MGWRTKWCIAAVNIACIAGNCAPKTVVPGYLSSVVPLYRYSLSGDRQNNMI